MKWCEYSRTEYWAFLDSGQCFFPLQIPRSLVEIMQKLPECRSKKEVLLLRKIMISMDIFCHYSDALQLLLAKAVRYQRLGSRRVVIKRGDAAHSFYFVFSGLLAVTKDEDGSSAFVDKEPILIKRGMSFGDVALIKGLKRNATIVCMEETELMVVDKEDFFSNRMDVELQKEFENRFNFFRSLELFSSWSCSSIDQITKHTKIERFGFEHIVDKEANNEMSNIIFIAEGRCDVFRVVDLTSCGSYQHFIKQHQNTGIHGNRNPEEQRVGSCKNKPHTQIKAATDLSECICFLIDSLHQGSTFGLNEHLLPVKKRDCRKFTLLSQSVQIVRLEKSLFDELVDPDTLKKLENLQKTYPSDEELCKFFLKHKRWQDYKRCLVQDILSHRIHKGNVSQTPFPFTQYLHSHRQQTKPQAKQCTEHT
ncbi:hypothetical protein NFI96_012785 [Prochilodus magdalenae]|nr:hypothetical protein NFI96_012785 [Prochilodus magdalenae]